MRQLGGGSPDYCHRYEDTLHKVEQEEVGQKEVETDLNRLLKDVKND